MRKMRLLLAVGIFLSALNPSFAQEKINIKYGKVTAADFDLSKQKFDTAVHAVVLADIGNSTFEGNNKSWFTLVFKRHTRIKILNKNALDAANVNVYLYFNGTSEEKIEGLKGVTYNLENGKVIETKMDGGSVFTDKKSKNLAVKKFSLPAVKEGSIIEYSYTVKSDFMQNLQPWTFQGEYPVLWSEYEVGIPEFFHYVTLSQGYQPYHINKSEKSSQIYNVTVSHSMIEKGEIVPLTGSVTYNKWVMKEVPALKKENYTSTIDNHVAKIEFQLAQINIPNQPIEEVMSNWIKVGERLMNDESFGASLKRNNNWLDDDMKKIIAGATTPVAKARLVYNYVQQNFTCTRSHSVEMDNNNSLKTVFKAKAGSVAEINLLLTAMLKHEAINADPVILSTREMGVTHELYPLMDRFNYVICSANIDNVPYFLDASEPILGFGKLDPKCYNGHARIIKEFPEPVYFLPDSVREKKMTAIYIMNGDKDKMQGSFTSTLGYFESIGVRENVKSKGEAEVFKKIKSSYAFDIDINEKNIDSLKKNEEPVAMRYSFAFDKPQEDILYMNPMMTEGYKENPFQSAERFYPVEMPSTFDETYIFTMEVPQNYVVDEIPKSAKISFNDGEGYFEYLISKSDTQIQMRSRLYLNRAVFEPDEYQTLRDFFSYVVKKHSEQIVFKKKKS